MINNTVYHIQYETMQKTNTQQKYVLISDTK